MDTAQQALFRAMLNDGWFTSSDGNVQSPTGYFGFMINTQYELKEVYDTFTETIDAYGKPDDNDVIGYWFASINSDGIITIIRCSNRVKAYAIYRESQHEFTAWLNT